LAFAVVTASWSVVIAQQSNADPSPTTGKTDASLQTANQHQRDIESTCVPGFPNLLVKMAGALGNRYTCYSPRSVKDVNQAKKHLDQILQRSLAEYRSSFSQYRMEYGVILPNGLVAQSRSHARLETVSFLLSTDRHNESVMRLLAANCGALSSALDHAALSGLALYADHLREAIGTNATNATSETVKDTFGKIDTMYQKLISKKDDLVVNPNIVSAPIGADIYIATQRQMIQHKYEFIGTTNTKGVNLFRGVYDYQVNAQGYTPFVGELDLIDNYAATIVCTPQNTVRSLVCIPQ
jgi:hypothetical protein